MRKIRLVLGLLCALMCVAACDSAPPLPEIPTRTPAPPAPQNASPIPISTVKPANPTTAQTTALPPNRSVTKLGVHLMLEDLKNHWPVQVWPQHLSYARQLVGEWGYVVALVRLDDLDPDKWQLFFDLCYKQHLTPILRFATFYDNEHRWWAAPIRDGEGGGYFTVAEQYRDFLDHLRWPTNQHYVIIGNEPNRGDEWENQPNGEAYAHFLGDVSRRLRENDSKIIVLNGALDLYAPNTNGKMFDDGYSYIDADTFLNQMAGWDKDIFKKIQIWNAHAYPQGPFNQGPFVQAMQFDYLNGSQSTRKTPWPAGLANRGINSYNWELAKIAELGAAPLPVMITETGWRHVESTDPAAADSSHANLSAQQVADFFQLAFTGNKGSLASAYPQTGWTPWEDDPRVVAVIPFTLDGSPDDWGHSNWLVLDSNGFVTGTYPQFQRMLELRKAK
jgi:hypothetical protein